MLSYTLPCPLPTVPDPANAYVTVGASSATTGQGRLPVSAAAAPAVAKAAGHQLSPAIEARCNAKVKASNMASGGAASRDGVTTTIHIVTSVIQRRYSRDNTRRVYINVSHAIPPHIPLNRLPSIPPSAGDTSRGGSASSGVFDTSFGASLAGNEEYFSPTVFNSIVVAPGGGPGTPNPHHYHQNPLNPAPNPILPPNSLHYSILERFIPPENVAEDANMFSPTCSILLDRLVELSNQGGSLLFIYPTKAGARQFCRNVLGPVIDPLLRKLMVLYGLREDLLWRIRNMGAVEGMADWDQLKTRVDNFCKTLSTGNGSSSALGGKMPVRMVFASTAKVRLNDESWREWWSQQEQMRIREVVKRHFSSMPPLPTPSAEEPGKNKPAGDATGGASAATKKLPLKKPMKPVIPVPGLGLISPTPPPVTPSGAAVKPLDTTATRPKPPTSAKIAPDLNLTPLPPIPHSSQMMVAPLSPEASAHYLGIRSPSLSSHGFHSSTSYYNSQTYSIMGPYEGPSSSNAAASNNNNPNSTIPITSATSPPASSSGFTMGYGAPGDLAREVLDGVRAPAVRPSSQGMGEAVMASALAGSGGNTAIGQGMGGVVGDGAWSSRSKGVNAGSSSKMEEQVAVVTPGGGWGWGIYADRRVEVGVFVLRKGR